MFLASCRTSKTAIQKPIETRSKPSEIANYEKLLGISLPNSTNIEFVKFISAWIGAPYKYGGNTTAGTDCSGFVNATYKSVFSKSIARSSLQLFKESKPIKENELLEGDLIFFDIQDQKISHVGMHITGNYFIHASTKKGVVINSREEPYYKQHFRGFGRIG
jgi:cell wall-associated NlpC family hydrolase